MKYSEVVEKAKKTLKSRGEYGNNKVTLSSCEVWEKGNQINLWAYWQGYKIADIDNGIDILLVGQDWGNPDKAEESVSVIRQIQSGDDKVFYPYAFRT